MGQAVYRIFKVVFAGNPLDAGAGQRQAARRAPSCMHSPEHAFFLDSAALHRRRRQDRWLAAGAGSPQQDHRLGQQRVSCTLYSCTLGAERREARVGALGSILLNGIHALAAALA